MKLRRPGRALLGAAVCLFACLMLVWRALPMWSAAGPLGHQLGWLALGLGAGIPKGWFVIRRSSARIVARIEASPGPVWFWQTYPAYFYPLVGVMITAGVLVRRTFALSAPGAVFALYVGVGAALAVGSLPFFRAASRFRAARA